MNKKRRRRGKSTIKISSKQHAELKQIKDTLLKAKEMLEETKEAMEKYAEKNECDARPTNDLIISKKD